jgi:phosphate-induced protein 1
VTISTVPASAQRGTIRTDGRILYHDGPVMQGTSAVYLIWYGNWTGNTAQSILTDLASNIGSSPYFQINRGYPDANGATPSGGLIYAGAVYDAYSHGPTLTVENIQQVVADQIAAGNLPLDTAAIYFVIGSADVTDYRPQPDGKTYTSFCTPGASPHHGYFTFSGATVKYGYLGNYDRCPTSAPNGGLHPTPNDNFGADAMASTMVRLLSVIVTNPVGNGWYDRYGLQNADKCPGKFGTTYSAANGAQANMRLGQRDFLMLQNWVNDRRGRCALSILD